MKILLIQAPMGPDRTVAYPLGLANLAQALYHMHEVQILDANCQAEQDINSAIEMYNPDVIGLGLRNIDNSLSLPVYYYFRYFPSFVNKVKKLSPNSILIVGGAGYSVFPREVMKSCPEIDFGVQFEAEEILPLLHSILILLLSPHRLYLLLQFHPYTYNLLLDFVFLFAPQYKVLIFLLLVQP